MLILGYRLLFSELCVLLNIRADPDADYVEDDHAREQLESRLKSAIQNTDMTIMELEDNIFYLGLSVSICRDELPAIMSSREMCERVANLTVRFKRALKRVGLFKHLNVKQVSYPDPYIIQCDVN
jgi:hypothetical protein